MAFDGSRADYFTEKARQVRVLASQTHVEVLKEEYEAMAVQYDRLATAVRSGLLRP
jgi:hypothetical protein